MARNKEASLKVLRKLKESKKIRESMREDFYDWYDSLTDYAQRRFDDYLADEGYPDMITDLSNHDIEYLMMEFNPDYFEDEESDDYDESCKESKKVKKESKKSVKESKKLTESVHWQELEDALSYFGNNVVMREFEPADENEWDDPEYGGIHIEADLFMDRDGALIDPDDIPTGYFGESKKIKKESKVRRSIRTTLEEGKLHRFTKTDWYGWAGAERFPDGSDPYIYEDPETGNAVIVSYDSYADDIVVEVEIWKDDSEVIGFTKTYQGNRDQAIADAEDIIRMGWLRTGDPNAFGNGWEHTAG